MQSENVVDEEFVTDFWVYGEGKNSREAFIVAKRGSKELRRKHSYKLLCDPAKESPEAFAERVVAEATDGPHDPYDYENEKGPALCVELIPGKMFLFFGLVSS
jgi:hypothetical protein